MANAIILHRRRSEKIETGTALSNIEEGQIVKIAESGTPVEFYLAKHDYESSLNGAGRTLVVRKDCYDQRQWHTSNVNAYASSAIDSWLNSTYKNLLDADIRSLIGTTKIRYTPGNGNWNVSTLERSVFLLSLTELGESHTYANTEGSALPIASTLKIAYQNGSPTYQWTAPRTRASPATPGGWAPMAISATAAAPAPAGPAPLSLSPQLPKFPMT